MRKPHRGRTANLTLYGYIWTNVVLETFATEAGADQDKIILLVQDRAGWHRSQKVNLPSGIKTEFFPASNPELQPAERLWSLVDEAISL